MTDEASPELNERSSDASHETITTHPTIRPTLVWLVATFVVAAGAGGYVLTNTERFGGPDSANIIANAIFLLLALAVVRFLVRVYVLSRTEYHVTDRSLKRQYDLLFRSTSREVPFAKIRSHEFRQGRVEKLLGFGTIHVNQGLGSLDLEHVPNPRELHQQIQRRLESSNGD